MRGFLKPLIVVAVYHLLVGTAVVSTISTERPLSLAQKAEFVVIWPVVVGATNYLQSQFVIIMDDIKGTLNELNSGQWERKTP